VRSSGGFAAAGVQYSAGRERAILGSQKYAAGRNLVARGGAPFAIRN
jgi:hypothetical protein